MCAAVVLAGGRARRLDGTSKPDLVVGDHTLLERTYAACRDIGAQLVVVVGPQLPSWTTPDGPPVVWTREDPPFAGPARAVAAGVAALADHPLASGARVAVLACDMPHVGTVLPVLAEAADAGPGSVVAVTTHVQWLLGIHPWKPLHDVCAALPPGGANESVRALLAPLHPREVRVDPAGAEDIDTWVDLRRAREQ